MTILHVQLPPRPLTLEDVSNLAETDPDHRYELQEGNLLVMPPADEEHAEIVVRVGAWLLAGGYGGRVLASPGLRVGASGRSPDIAVRRSARTARVVWIDPAEVLLAVEIVSPGSTELDRHLKPVEYARAGIPNYWRIEREGTPTLHAYRLAGTTAGEPAYTTAGVVALEDLLAGPVPTLDDEP